MLAPQALVKGIVQRQLPPAYIDDRDSDKAVRFGRYGEQYTLPIVRKQHGLVDEGSYFTCHNNQSAITGPSGSSFSETAAAFAIVNTDSPSSPNAKRVYLDYARLENGGTAMSAQTTASASFWAITIDNTNRYSSAGTALTTPSSPNIDISDRAAVGRAYFGAVVATTQTTARRVIVGQRLLRVPVSATAFTLANFDTFEWNFGGVEAQSQAVPGSSGTLSANVNAVSYRAPAVVIGPGMTALIHLWVSVTGTVTAGTFFPELGWWER